MRLIRATFIVSTLLALSLAGCVRHSTSPRIAATDLRAIDSIYQTSSGIFHNSGIEIQVREGGGVELAMHGEVQPKPETEGDVWIPVLLSKKLPEYFQVMDAKDSPGIVLEAYQFKGGLWCIAAVIPQLSKAVSSSPLPSDVTSRALDFRIALASLQYSDRLPFLIPSGQTGEPVAVSIGLPNGSHFSSSVSNVDLTSIRGWRDSHDFDAAESTTAQALTPVPRMIAANGTNVAATLYSPDAVALDLSAITFSQPGFLSKYRPWFLQAALLLTLCAVGLWLRLDIFAGIRTRLSDLKEFRDRELSTVEKSLHAVTILFRQLSSDEPDDKMIRWAEEWRETASFLRAKLRYTSKPGEPLHGLDKLRKFLDRFGSEVEPRVTDGKARDAVDEIHWELGSLTWHLESLAHGEIFLVRSARTRRFISRLLWGIGALALTSALLLLADLARGQAYPGSSKPRTALVSMLCDLDILLIPRDTQAQPTEKVDVQLRFSPLSSDSSQKTMTVAFGTGDLPNVTIDPVASPPDPKITVQKHSSNLILLGVPTTYSPMLRRIGALSRLMVQFKVPAKYTSEIATWNQVTFSYTLQGSEVLHMYSRFGKHWLHLFPFDSADVEIPLDVRQAALLSHLELKKPSADYFADVSVEGLPISVSESENGDRYEFINSDPTERVPLWNDHRVTLHARFHRSPFQVWGLTAGLGILSILVGIVGGWVITLPDKSWQGFIITTVGALGLVIGVRAAVLSAYKNLPTLMTGQGTTYFELIYLTCILLMAGVIWLTQRALK